LITPDTGAHYLILHVAGKLHFIVNHKEGAMKKMIKLVIAGVLVATTLSACIVVPAGPGYYRPYHDGYRGGYYGR
jgi:hypothetical protein